MEQCLLKKMDVPRETFGRRLRIWGGAIGILLVYTSCRTREESFQIIENKSFMSSSRCGECHAEVYQEWRASAHGTAWHNPAIRAATRDFSRTECRMCHSAEPILVTGPGKLPVFRPHHEEESIGCLTCHGLPEGGVASASLTDLRAFCRPRAAPGLRGMDLCGSCHNVTHFVVDEWRASPFPARGVDCNSCHMPEVERTDGGKGRSHAFPGCRDKLFLKGAIEWEVRRAAGRLAVEIENRAGHQFPGEFPDREFHIVATFTGEGEDQVRVERTILKPPPRSARSLSASEREKLDNRLRPLERRAFFFDLPEWTSGAEVQLIYKRFPALLDGEADLLGEWHEAIE